MRKSLIKIISTFFYVGYLPLIPGTFGSIAGLVIYYLVKDSLPVYLITTGILIFLGFITSDSIEKSLEKKDPSCVVIDEVSGMMLSLLFIPFNLKLVIVGFFLFRLFDTLKPYPAGRFEKLRGGLGIMSDDLIAGLYTNLVLQIALKFASFWVS